MKSHFVSSLLAVFVSLTVQAQSAKLQPELLQGPAGWAFEQFALPPVFAPGFPWHGIEELRFSPGMFHKDSADYFTYAFAARLDSVDHFSVDDLRNYLLLYFKGLCGKTAADRKLAIDTAQIRVTVAGKMPSGNAEHYSARLQVFGVFADGAPVALSMEIKMLRHLPAREIYLVFIASTKAKTDKVWTALYRIQQGFMMPAH